MRARNSSTGESRDDDTEGPAGTHQHRVPEEGILPKGGIARFYGRAKIYRSGLVYEEVWRRLVQPEKDRDPEKKGHAVLIEIERAEELDGTPLNLD